MAIYVDDKELVAAHQAGDTEAFEELVKEYRLPLLAHGQRKLLCADAAEDAVQETLVRAYRALPRFNGEYRLGPWLHRIMANVCVDEINRRSRDGQKIEKVSSQPLTDFDSPGVEEELGLHLDQSAVSQALGELPDSYSQALKLRFVDELEYDQLAKVAGVSEQNARARVSRARNFMKTAMKGVAVSPALLLGLLKRGEKAAAATSTVNAAALTAGSSPVLMAGKTASAVSSSLPAIADSVSAASPVVLPAVTKAAVGIGLVAAVLTPTSDSAVHSALGELVADSTSMTMELPEERVVQTDTSNDVVVELVEPAEIGVSEVAGQRLATGEFEKTEDLGLERLPVTSGSQRLPVEFVEARSLETSDVGGGRHSLAGAVSYGLQTVPVTSALLPSSWIRLDLDSEGAGISRFDALLVIAAEDGSLLEIHLAGFSVEQGATFDLKGLALLPSDSPQENVRARYTGTLKISAENQPGRLDIALQP